jgi:uncharacterized protein (DUF1697 family)
LHRYIVLLRAVNVGGTGKLPMVDLKVLCEELGFQNVRTYIASGNVVLDSKWDVETSKAMMEKRLHEYANKPVGVHIRTPDELIAIFYANPFPHCAGNRNLVTFLDHPTDATTLLKVTGQVDEVVLLGKREIYICYGETMGSSKLKIPAAKTGTARNMNTVTKLIEMCGT